MPDNSLPTSRSLSERPFLQMVVPAILLCGIVAFIWRFFKYYVDPDAISYLNITAKYVAGDYAHAINAFWSPMGCWLTAVLVKVTHAPLFQSAIIINTIPAAGMVMAGQKLFSKFRTDTWERWCFGIMSAFFWSYTVYYQSFTDIWQFFFLTIGLLILLKASFTSKPFWWIALGVVGCLSFYGKAYSFIFYPVMIIVVTAIKLQSEGNFKIRKLVTVSLVSILVMMLCASPWIYLIHHKYGVWTYSTAGKLNMSWWLVGTQEFKDGIHALVPPPYKESLFYFEDPFLAQGRIAHFWDSPHLFLKQLIRVGYNVIGWVESANRISAFYFVVWVYSILFFVRKQQTIFKDTNMKILVVLLLIFPLPYWLLTFDGGRYLWFTIPLVSILALYFSDLFIRNRLSTIYYRIFVAVFFITFIITPVVDMKGMVKKGFKEHQIAEQLKELQIQGTFVANKSYADDGQAIIRLSWFSQNPWYCHTLSDYSTKELQEDARRYNIKYYFYFYEGSGNDYIFRNLEGKVLEDLTKGTIPGLKVYQIGQ